MAMHKEQQVTVRFFFFFSYVGLMGEMPFDTRLFGQTCTPCFYEVSEGDLQKCCLHCNKINEPIKRPHAHQ